MRKVVGVPNGEGKSGSILRFALRDVRKAALNRQPPVLWCFAKSVFDIVPTNSHTTIPLKVNIPALVRNPGSEGIAGIAFSKPVNWLVMTVSPREYRCGNACGPGGTLRCEGGSWRPIFITITCTNFVRVRP